MGSGQALQQVAFFALLILGLYVLAIRPQRARARALAEVRAGLAVGTRVITTAGIHATVTAVEGDDVLLEIAPGVVVRFVSVAVVRITDETDRTDNPDRSDDPDRSDEPTATGESAA